MSKYENDIHNPGDLILVKLANYYGVTVEKLLEENDAELPEKCTKSRLCPWRIKKGINRSNEAEMTWFLPCMGEQCMAYEDGACGRIKKQCV